MRVIVLLLLLSTTAHADPAARTESYTTTAAVVDSVGLALAVPGVIAIAKGEGSTRTYGIVATSIGGALWVFGTPITHYIKQDTKDRYYLSLGMRILLPGIVAGVVAKTTETCEPGGLQCDLSGTAIALGLSITAVAVTAFDAAFLAKRRVTIASKPRGVALGFAF